MVNDEIYLPYLGMSLFDFVLSVSHSVVYSSSRVIVWSPIPMLS